MIDIKSNLDRLEDTASILYNQVQNNGTYQADNDDDGPLAPLARFGFEGRVFCYVYDYGVAAVRIGLDGPYKIARFD